MTSGDSVCISEGLDVPKSALVTLNEIDEQLAFLAILTLAGVKPMSRWEKPLAAAEEDLLRQVGLQVARSQRTALNGTEVTETLFSRTGGYIEFYRYRWNGQPLDKSPAAMRLEGFLFGYPPCCVEAYIRSPYAANDLHPAVRGRLFHWACKGCVITPLLVPVYQRLEALREFLCSP